MVKKYELSSTEQLLDVIRGTKEILGNSSGDSGVRNASGSRVSIVSGSFDPRKTTVGISYDATGIRLVAVEGAGKRRRIVDFAHIDTDLPESVEPRTIAEHIVKQGYDRRFLLRKTKTWLVLCTESIDQWTITVPKRVEGKEEATAVYWAAKAKKKFDDAVQILDYYRIDTCTEKGIDKLRIGAFTIPRKEVRTARKSFARVGIPLAGISSFFLCSSSLFDRTAMKADDAPLAVIWMDKDWSRIDLFLGNALAFTRRIKTGMDSLAVSIQERYQKSADPFVVDAGEVELELDLEEKELRTDRLTMDEALSLLEVQGLDASAEASDPPVLSDEIFMELVEPAVQRLVRQIERTFDHFRTSMKVPAVNQLLFGGQVTRYAPVLGYIGSQLALDVDVLDPFAANSLHASRPVPSSPPARSVYAPAVAAALSSRQDTPNFLYTYADKSRDARLKKLHRSLVAFFLGGILALGGYFSYSQQVLASKEQKLRSLTSELSEYEGDVDGRKTRRLLDEYKQQTRTLNAYADRFFPVALLGEIARITPPSVRINSLISNTNEDGQTDSLIIDGVVLGTSTMLDSLLANYLIILEDSPLVAGVTIQKQNRTSNTESEKIQFVVNLQIV